MKWLKYGAIALGILAALSLVLRYLRSRPAPDPSATSKEDLAANAQATARDFQTASITGSVMLPLAQDIIFNGGLLDLNSIGGTIVPQWRGAWPAGGTSAGRMPLVGPNTSQNN